MTSCCEIQGKAMCDPDKKKLFVKIAIETHANCNRRCKTCLRETCQETDAFLYQVRKTGEVRLSAGTIFDILDQLALLKYGRTVQLSHYNEPLMDERIAAFTAYAKAVLGEYGAKIELVTNGDLLTEERAVELDGLLDEIAISLYMPEAKQPAAREWFRSMFRRTKPRFTDGSHIVTHWSPFANRDEAIETAIKRPCTHYSDQLHIACDGTVLYCCQDYTGHWDLGNVYMDSLAEIWFSMERAELDDILSKPGGREKYEYCKICPVYTRS